MSTVAELMADLAAAPRFPGARCRDQWRLFDTAAAGRSLPRVQVAQAQARAIALCRGCPALQACAAWVDGLEPWQRPRGVVAGRLNTSPAPKPPGESHLMPSGRTSTPQTALGWRLRELRAERQWQQLDVARLVGTEAGRVSQWEIGRITPTLAVLQKIADAFDLALSELLDGIRCEQQTGARNRKGHKMNEENEDGEFDIDNLEEAVASYRSRPRDVVKKVPFTGSNDDVVALDGQTVEVTHYERTDDGVTERRTRETFAAPVVKHDEGPS